MHHSALLLATVLAALPLSGCAPPRLTPDHTARLQALGIPVAVPGYVPPGFSATEVHTDPGGAAPLDGPTYTIRYTSGDGACFTVETATGGLGGPVPEHRRVLHAPAFPAPGDIPYHVYWTNDVPEAGFRPQSLFSDWMEEPPVFYRIASGGAVPGDCRRIAPETAVRIAESLRIIRERDGPL